MDKKVYCPECNELTYQEAIDQWEMCHDCENQLCPECNLVFCEHD